MNDIYDVIIIGSGMVGTMSAYLLKDSGKKILLLEKNKEEKNATAKSTGKISYLQKDIYQKLEKYHDKETCRNYFNSQYEAMEEIVNIIKKEKIECGLEKVDTYLFTIEEKNKKKIEKEKKILENFGVECFSSDSLPIPYPIHSAFYVKDNYVFYPFEFLKELRKIVSKKITIKDKTLVTNIKKKENYYLLTTDNGNYKAKKVMVATHYPFFLIKDLIPLRAYVKQEYITTGKIKEDYQFSAINIEKETESILMDHHRLFYIGKSNKCTDKKWTTTNIQKNESMVSSHFQLSEMNSYMNQDLITNDSLPFIGSVDKDENNIFIASGFNAWGMTNGVLASMILSDIILGKENPYENLFRVKRMSLMGTLQMMMNGILEAKAYLKNIFYQPKKIYKVKMNGKSYYVYVDENHQRHYIETKCPHLKCNLLFNQEEKTWDCPCHGSRFDMDGNLLESPSKKYIGKEEKE